MVKFISTSASCQYKICFHLDNIIGAGPTRISVNAPLKIEVEAIELYLNVDEIHVANQSCDSILAAAW